MINLCLAPQILNLLMNKSRDLIETKRLISHFKISDKREITSSKQVEIPVYPNIKNR